MYFKVQVVDDDGDGVAGCKVTVVFTSVLRGFLEEYSDDDGQAEFGFDALEPGSAEIFTGGEKHGPYYIEDGGGFTITL
jgi:hypothetical protein